MSAPKLVESIPHAGAPVRLSEVREERARFLAGVITGGVLIALVLGLLIVAAVVL